MHEQIEKDREYVRNGIFDMKQHRFSYLKYLRSEEAGNYMLEDRINNMTTIDILTFLNTCFENGKRDILDNIDKFEYELKKRKDLFQNVIEFLDKKNIKSTLYYWIPGHTIGSIFAFIAKIMPDFSAKYKRYFAKNLIINKSYIDCMIFIKEFYQSEYIDFEIMKMDLNIFDNCISGNYWPDVNTEYNSICTGIKDKIDLNNDIDAKLVPALSFVEVEINGKALVMNLVEFDKFMCKNNETKEFWKNYKVNE